MSCVAFVKCVLKTGLFQTYEEENMGIFQATLLLFFFLMEISPVMYATGCL